MQTLKTYYKLTKPGIIRGNLFAVVAGFLLASRGDVDIWLGIWTAIGSALVIAGGCVFNNFIDRDIDKKMTRTSKRAMPTGSISPLGALVYGAILGFFGFVVLYNFTNNLTVFVGLFGLLFYVFVYAYFKRATEYGTLIGSISGAIPPLAGYVAVSNEIDKGAIAVFLILVFWQLPHFYAITIFRAREYAKAGIPVLSLTRGIKVAKYSIVAYIPVFITVSLLPYFYSLVGRPYVIIMTIAGIYWLYTAVVNFNVLDDEKWAKKVFGTSLLVLTAFTLAIFIDQNIF